PNIIYEFDPIFCPCLYAHNSVAVIAKCFAQVSSRLTRPLPVMVTDFKTVSGEAPQIPVVSRKSGMNRPRTISERECGSRTDRNGVREASDRSLHFRKWRRANYGRSFNY